LEYLTEDQGQTLNSDVTKIRQIRRYPTNVWRSKISLRSITSV